MTMISIRLTVCVAAAAGLAACGTSTPTSPSATVTGVIVLGTQQLPSVGLRTPLSAFASYSDNTTQTITTLATWQSTNPAVVSVSQTGVAIAQGPGCAIITATYQGVTGSLQVTVATPSVEACQKVGGGALLH